MSAKRDPLPEFGRYRIIGRLGAGGMGIVYEAEDPEIGRRVAIKATKLDPSEEATFGDELRERFEREFRAAGQLSHPHIVTVHDVGTQGGVRWVAMELTEGGSLKERLEQLAAAERRLPRRRVAELGLQIGAALDYAHGRQLVHRDVKPANILLTADGVPKLADFGLVKTAGSELTSTQAVLGTLPYMAPEQLTGEGDGPPSEASPRSDQYSLAVVLYEALTGTRPHTADSAGRLVLKIANEAPRPPTELESALPPQVDRVLMRALSKHPAERFAACSELARRLALAIGAEEESTMDTAPVGDALADAVLAGGAPATEPVATEPMAPRGPAVPARGEPVGVSTIARRLTAARQPWLPLVLGVVVVGLVAGAWSLGLLGGGDRATERPGRGPGSTERPGAATPEPAVAGGEQGAARDSRSDAADAPAATPGGEPAAPRTAPIDGAVAVMGGPRLQDAVDLPAGTYTLTEHLAERQYTYFRVALRSGQLLELFAQVTRNIPTAAGEGLHASNVRVNVYDARGVEIRGVRAAAIGSGSRDSARYFATQDETVVLAVGADFNAVHRDSLFGLSVSDHFDADSGRDLGADSEHVLAGSAAAGSIGLQDAQDRYRIATSLAAGTEAVFVVTPDVETRLLVELYALDGRRLGRSSSRRGANTLRLELAEELAGAYLLITDRNSASSAQLARYTIETRTR